MLPCWNLNSGKRPSFRVICRSIEIFRNGNAEKPQGYYGASDVSEPQEIPQSYYTPDDINDVDDHLDKDADGSDDYDDAN